MNERPSGEAAPVRPGHLLAAAGVSALAVAAAVLVSPPAYEAGDANHYLRMVAGGPGDACAPFAYRVLVPALVKLLPLPPREGFLALTLAGTFLTLLATWLLLRSLRIPQAAALTSVWLLGLSYPVALYLGAWGLVDPEANLCLVLTLLALARRRWAPACAAICAGVLVKETSLLLVPVLLWQARPGGEGRGRGEGRRSWLRVALLAAAPAAVWAAPRLMVHPAPGAWDIRSAADIPRVWGMIWAYNTGTFGFVPRVAREILRSYGFVWVTAALGLRWQPRWRAACGALVAGSAVLCVFATDWSRMLGWGFPGVFIPTAFFLDSVARGRAGGRAVLLLLGALGVAQCGLALVAYRELPAARQAPFLAATAAVFCAGSAVAWFARARAGVGARAAG